ncbi:MAG: hypothetical protein DYH12_23080 [Sorangiineae bacterium PRO1]|nr:hypothetical protein [Sorangiineae bacterium PRO1]
MLFDECDRATHAPCMNANAALVLAIEKNELRFWTFARRVLERWRETAGGELDGAVRWADDALRARHEEIAYLSSRVRAGSSRPPAREPRGSATVAA